MLQNIDWMKKMRHALELIESFPAFFWNSFYWTDASLMKKKKNKCATMRCDMMKLISSGFNSLHIAWWIFFFIYLSLRTDSPSNYLNSTLITTTSTHLSTTISLIEKWHNWIIAHLFRSRLICLFGRCRRQQWDLTQINRWNSHILHKYLVMHSVHWYQ